MSVLDFIYLDIERVRSLVAQASGGIPTERTSGSEHQSGGQVSGSGGVPFFAKMGGQAEYHYVRSATETRSVQDAIFSEFLDHCHPLAVTSETPWSDVQQAPDGRVVSVHGHVKIIDYQSSLEALRTAPKLLDAFAKFDRTIGKKGGASLSADANAINRNQIATYSPIIESLSKLVGVNLADFIRMRAVPNLSHPAHALIGDCFRDFFRYPSALLTTLYPRGWAQDWHIVGLTHRSTPPVLDGAGQAAQQTMGDMLEGLLDATAALTDFQQTARDPEVAITPLAVYRDIIYD